MTITLAELNDLLVQVLIHSLWQSALISLLVWAVLRPIPARRAELRYGVALAGLASLVVAALATCSVLRLDADIEPTNRAVVPDSVLPGPAPVAVDHATLPSPQVTAAREPGRRATPSISFFHRLTPVVAALWFIGAALMLLRGLIGQVAVRTWIAATPVAPAAAEAVKGLVQELSQGLKLRRQVGVLVTDRLAIPAVMGMLWPTVLVPSAMLSTIPLDQWRIIIAHELAHVRRWDAIVSLVQMIVESLLFFNPPVWWLSRQIHREREACCDALAAQVCGQPVSVARALVDVASRVTADSTRQQRNRTFSVPPATLAFAEPAQEGDLTDRVRRLVDPDQAPRSRISWLSLTTMTVILITVVIMLQRGTDLAVRAAADWMSPREKIEKLAHLEAERNGIIVPLAQGPQGVVNASPSPTADNDQSGNRIPVHLIVKTEDGSEVTPRLNLHSLSIAGTHSSGNSIDPPQAAVAEYKKTLYFPPCTFCIGAMQQGYAAAISPVTNLMAGESEKIIELILTTGRTIDVVVKDGHGNPIPNAWVQQSVQMGVRGSTSGLGGGEKQTNQSGQLQLEHIGNAGYAFNVMAPGFQQKEFKRSFQSDSTDAVAPLAITLEPARPTEVRIMDAVTGHPIESALVRMVNRQGPGGSSSYSFSRRSITPSRWYDFGTSDPQGRVRLDRLQDDMKYTLAVIADGYGTDVVKVKPGMDPQTVLLRPAVSITGRITGALDRLQPQTAQGASGRQVSGTSNLAEHFNDSFWVNVDGEGHFTVEGLTVGKPFWLGLPDGRWNFVPKDGDNQVQIEIKATADPTNVPRREVVIRLTGTAPEAPARGSLSINWHHPTVPGDDSSYGILPIRENEVRVTAPVGATLRFEERGLIGYCISEQSDISIVPGTEPQVILVPASPAGGIHGVITRADGTPATQAFVTIFATRLPRSEKDHRRINPSSSSGGSQYLRTVPIGGRYRVLAREQLGNGCLWSLSDEVTIDESTPISQMNIQLSAGASLPVKLIDEAGQPVGGQKVELNIHFELATDSTAGLSFRIEGESDDQGIAQFGPVSANQNLGPIKTRLNLITKSNPYVGTSNPIDPGRPVEVKLRKGVAATGIVIDSKSNRPIPNASIRLVPRQFSAASFKEAVTGTTDSSGQAHFSGLESIEYTGYIEGAYPKGTVIESVGGGLRFKYPAGVEQLTLDASRTSVVFRWEVVIAPNSELKPLD